MLRLAVVCFLTSVACVGPLPGDSLDASPAMAPDAGQGGVTFKPMPNAGGASLMLPNNGKGGIAGMPVAGPGIGGAASGGMLGAGGMAVPASLPISPFEVSRRLALFLGNTNAGMINPADLTNRQNVGNATRDFVRSGQAFTQLRKFYSRWLQMDRLRTIGIKDPALTDVTMAAMLEEPLAFALSTTARTGLLTEFFFPKTFQIPPALVDLYQTASGSQQPTQRFGLLTMPGILAMGTSLDRNSPTKRGRFIREQFLCHPIPPPPPNVDMNVPPSSSWNGRTLREELGTLKSSPTCETCHRMIDNIGFAYETFDLLGRLRKTDNGKPIDVSGDIDGVVVDGPGGVAMTLANSHDMQSCFVRKWIEFAAGEIGLNGPPKFRDLEDSIRFADEWARMHNYQLTEVIAGVAMSPGFLEP